MNYAESVDEAVSQLATVLEEFTSARQVLSMEQAKDAWENLREHCQQLSGWIEHGRGVTEEMKPELCKTLYAAEKVLLDYRQYSRKKLYYKDGR